MITLIRFMLKLAIVGTLLTAISNVHPVFNQIFNVGATQKQKQFKQQSSPYIVKREQTQQSLIQTLSSLKEAADEMNKFLQSEELKQVQKKLAETREQEGRNQGKERSSRSGRSGGYRPSYGGRSSYSSPYSSPYAGRGRSSYGDLGGRSYDSGYNPSSSSSSSGSSSQSPLKEPSSPTTFGSGSSGKKDDQQMFYGKKDADKDKEKEKPAQDPQQQVIDTKFDNLDKIINDSKKLFEKKPKGKTPVEQKKELITTNLSNFTKEMKAILDKGEEHSKDKRTAAKKKLVSKSNEMLKLLLSGDRLADYIKSADIKSPADYQAFNEFFTSFKAITETEGVGTQEEKDALAKKENDFKDKIDKELVKQRLEKRYKVIDDALMDIVKLTAAITNKELKALAAKGGSFGLDTQTKRKAITAHLKSELDANYQRLEVLKDFVWMPNADTVKQKLKDKSDEIIRMPGGIDTNIALVPGLLP